MRGAGRYGQGTTRNPQVSLRRWTELLAKLKFHESVSRPINRFLAIITRPSSSQISFEISRCLSDFVDIKRE